MIWANQPIHSFLVDCLNPYLQETSVQVVSPQTPISLVSKKPLYGLFRPSLPKYGCYELVLRKNMWSVADEPVEFEKEPVEVQDFMIFTNHLRGIYRMCLK